MSNADEDYDDPWDAIFAEGRCVGRLEWDSGGPGAGAGEVSLYLYRGAFYGLNDVDAPGPFETFVEAARATGLFFVNEATTSLWIDPQYRNPEADAKLNAKAMALLARSGG